MFFFSKELRNRKLHTKVPRAPIDGITLIALPALIDILARLFVQLEETLVKWKSGIRGSVSVSGLVPGGASFLQVPVFGL